MRAALLTIFCILSTALVYAHQPASIEAKYDSKAKSLHIQVNHTSENRKEHFVRRLIISLNGHVIESRNLFFQKNNSYTDLDFSLTAKDTDQITIQAYSERGGMLEQDFKISDILFKEEPATSKTNDDSAKLPSKMRKAAY